MSSYLNMAYLVLFVQVFSVSLPLLLPRLLYYKIVLVGLQRLLVLCFHSETSYGYEVTIIVRDSKISFLYLYTMTLNSVNAATWLSAKW